MNRSKFTEEKVIYALWQAEACLSADFGVAEATFYLWGKEACASGAGKFVTHIYAL